MTTVVFWDIDGTLLTTARAGVFALEEAAREVCGTDADLSSLHTAGLTDSEVAALVIEHCGGSADHSTVSAVLRAYERHLPERLHWRRGRVLAGVEAVLRDLSARPDVTCMLLTGNTAVGAGAKLAHYGLDAYFEGGVFCRAGDDRVRIARNARELARQKANGSPDKIDIVVVGDTPHDVRGGKAIHARTVALATGSYTARELAACEPWLTLECLPAPTRFAELLGLGRAV
jgi:phosphoglycolate phosphatase-like HAD superfamily hydrolase